MRDGVIVLKLGGSVLTDAGSLRTAVNEAYRWRREGWRVVAVVSALAGRTDALLGGCDPHADDHAVAATLARGERESAASLARALDRAGLSHVLADAVDLGLRAAGRPLDASPAAVDTPRLRVALDAAGVVVVPGFIAIGAGGEVVTLGRGGSDLTALVLAYALGGARCRLIKDVDGLYERDPAAPGPPPRRFAHASYDDALALDGSVLQHKAVRFARDRGIRFEVAQRNSDRPTTVGPGPARLEPPGAIARRMTVACLGAGVVGGGVLELLAAMPERFETVGVAVRDADAHRDNLARFGVRRVVATPVDLARGGAGVVVEAMGGLEPAREAIAAALDAGSHVVTANKAVIARHGAELLALARERGVGLLASAAVGGSAPVLEAAGRCRPVRVRGVLNGTANHVLNSMASGATLEQALATARDMGLAEADPARDLDGRDSLDKLRVIASYCGMRDPERVDIAAADVRRAPVGRRLRQVASVDAAGVARVAIQPLDEGDPLADLPDEWNAAEITDQDGSVRVVRGRGAGRWPTAHAVLADVLDIERVARAREALACR